MARDNFTQVRADLVWSTSFNITDSTLRAITKIACNFFAFHNREAFCGPGFNEARRFVLGNEGTPPVQLFYPPLSETGAMGHGVAFEVQDGGEVTGVVTLFGHLCHRINMGHVTVESALPVRRCLYIIDQPGRTSKSIVPENPLAPFDHSCSLVDSIEAFSPFQRSNLIYTVEVADMVRELASLPENATESDRQRVVEERAHRIIDSLVRNGAIRFR